MASRVLIFGTGSIGATYAYALSRALPAKNIVTVCRSNYEAAVNNGFTIHSTIWGKNLNVRPTVARTVTEAVRSDPHGFDYAVVCSKVIPTQPSTAELLRPAIGSKTAIVLIQNGIAIEEDFAKLYPNNPLLSTVVYLPATQVSPAVVEHEEIELLHVGTYPSNAPKAHKDAAEAFVDLFRAAGASAELHDDVQTQRWKKLLVNCAWNPICALTRSRDRNFLNSSPEAESFIRDVMAEIATVAQACGQPHINKDVIDFQVSRALARDPPGVQPSMLADALGSRNMEVDAIIGNVVKLAQQKGIQTPLLRSVATLIRGLDYGFTST